MKTLSKPTDDQQHVDVMRRLCDNASDIGTVTGVLRGIKLTPGLLPNQHEALDDAIAAIERIAELNRAEVDRRTLLRSAGVDVVGEK